jgi:hypothetical protein
LSCSSREPEDESGGRWIEWEDTTRSGETIGIWLERPPRERPVRAPYLRAAHAARNGVRIKHVERLD